FGAFTIETTAPFAILILIALAVAILLIWQFCGWILGLPARGSIWRGRRVRRQGDQAITRLLVAMAADEKREAWREARRARRLLGDSPYTLLLLAEAGRLSGRDEEADRAFRMLAARKDARFLGLRGLLRQAMARQDWAEAVKLARQAEEARPGTTWLRQERTELALRTENWADALELVGQDDKRTAYYVAAADAETDNARALGYAKKAWQQDPSFVPAVLAYARRLRQAGQEKKAEAVIAKAWKRAPHPDLAAFALEPQPDAASRLRVAKRLAESNSTNPESKLLVAREALDAGSVPEARQYTERLLAEGFQQHRLYVLIAEIEEQERGDTEEGRLAQREALRQAAVADPDSRWQCQTCRTDYDAWRPKCTVCQSVGTITWTTTGRTEKTAVIEQALQVQS
ncbi:MAG TPA: heme biosynthesis HemY N-terminal domain-containing protein, partial [Rhodopila sp.]|nr:heme biosynthesis HemY N-terminal domain-containing protein [Rhodopila sp.]